MTDADVRVLTNLYNRKPSSTSLYSGTSSRTHSPTTDSPDVELGELEKKKVGEVNKVDSFLLFSIKVLYIYWWNVLPVD